MNNLMEHERLQFSGKSTERERNTYRRNHANNQLSNQQRTYKRMRSFSSSPALERCSNDNSQRANSSIDIDDALESLQHSDLCTLITHGAPPHSTQKSAPIPPFFVFAISVGAQRFV